ncbi:unnamed protein product, partial [Prorocentrum cordatum]
MIGSAMLSRLASWPGGAGPRAPPVGGSATRADIALFSKSFGPDVHTRGRKSVSIMEGHTDMRLRDLHDSPNDQTKLTKLTNGGRKLSIGSSA